MNKKSVEEIKKWLLEYATSFAVEEAARRYLVQLKLDHSLRVADDCALIASGLDWSDTDINLGTVIGLLHDVGRFSQMAEFGTFHDPDSIDHGERGYEVATTAGVLDDILDNENKIILEGIRYHNRRTLPDDVSDHASSFLHLVRDADKIDIMHIVKRAISNKDHERYPEIMLNIDLDGPVNPDIIAEIKSTGTASYKNVFSMADMNLIRISWIYNIQYRPALVLLSERGHLEEIIATLPDSEDVREITAKAVSYIESQLATMP